MNGLAHPRILALCAGIGGLELGIKLAVPGARVLAYVEREAYAAAVLLARMEDSSLEPAPVWCGNLEQLDLDPLLDRVDVLCAGFPCQPWSYAGKRLGTADERWIWPAIAAIVRVVRPRFVFLENVPGILVHGLGAVLADLAALGFDAQWTCVRASDVGAPHRRERVFVLAYAAGHGHDESATERGSERETVETRRPERFETQLDRQPAGRCPELADTPQQSEREPDDARRTDAWEQSRRDVGWNGGRLADPVSPGLARRPEQHHVERPTAERGSDSVAYAENADRRPESERAIQTKFGRKSPVLVPFPPGPGDVAGWERYLEEWPDLEPAIPRAQSSLRRGHDGVSARLDRLRALGNAVVPEQAAVAWRILYQRLTDTPR